VSVRLLLLVLLAGCGAEAPPPAEVKPAPAPAAPAGLVATMGGLGGLKADTPPTIVGVVGALGAGWTARKGAGDAIEAQRDGQTILTVIPAVNGTRIERVITHHPDVVFPWGVHVGDRIGAHKHWARMTCRIGERGVTDGAMCYAFEDAAFGYVVRGWSGDPGVVPAKDAVGELSIAELVWMPGGRPRSGG
jgi:hypothetical protein